MPDENERFKKMIEDSQDWFWEFDEHANFTYASPRIRELLGYEPEELIGLNAFDLMDADEARRVHAHFDPIAKKYLPFRNLINVNTHKDGRKVVIESSGTPIFDGEGRFRGYRGIDHDITGQKSIEEAFHKNQALLADTEHIAHVGSWKLDLTANTLSWSDEVYRIFGLVPQEFAATYEAFLDVVHPDDRAAVDAAYSGSLREDSGGYEIEHRIIRKNSGEIRHVHERCIHERDEAGTIVNSLGMVQDITERKRIEEELRHSREKLSDIVTLLSQCIYEADFSGRLTFANPAAFKLFGYSEEEFAAGLNILDMIVPEDVERARKNIGKMYMGAEEGGHEYTARRKDGTTFPVMIYSNVVRNDDSPVGMRGIIVDITKRKKYEQELEKARDAAESMSRAKDKFLANMSHELRTPITAVLGFAELLQGTDLSEPQQKYLGTIASSTETLLALVDDLLDLARIEAGKVYLEREEFSLRKVIGEIVDCQMPAAKAKRLAFRTRVSPEVPDRLMGDSLRLKQVLLNLTANSIKFSEVGEVVLSVAVEDSPPSTPLIRFDVADTGIGIRSEDMAEIFQPFSQLDPSSTRKFGGAGLGLAICTKLLAIMGGEITVESCEGVGSTFHVCLPFEVAGIEMECGGVRPVAQAILPEGVPLQVLLVEDHEVSRDFFAEVLKRCGHHVESAANGAEALGKLQCRTYDLVLMDVQMPVMDGLEAIGRIREMEKAGGGHLPVIALTAYAMEKDRLEILGKGFDGYVSKPMKINELLDEVKRCLSLPP